MRSRDGLWVWCPNIVMSDYAAGAWVWGEWRGLAVHHQHRCRYHLQHGDDSYRFVHLTHWYRVAYICASELTIIGSDNGLSPGRRQAIIWTNPGMLLIGTLGTNFSEILSKIQTFSIKKKVFENVVWKMAAIWSRPKCVYDQTTYSFAHPNSSKLCPDESTRCPASRTTLVATRFRVAVICPIIQVPHCIRVFFYFVWFVFINHIFQFYYELCTYCNILDIYLS